MSAEIIQHETVLDFENVYVDGAMFAHPDRPGDEYSIIPTELYEDFGQPEQITVTIRPGDHLNSIDARIARWCDMTGIRPCEWQLDMMRSILFDEVVKSRDENPNGNTEWFDGGEGRPS